MSEIDDLDGLFARAAAERAVPSPTLVARIVHDADAVQPKAPLRVVPQRGWLPRLADWFGGGFSLAGMSATALTGIYLGVMPPAPVLALAELVTGQTTIDSLDVLPQVDVLWAQE